MAPDQDVPVAGRLDAQVGQPGGVELGAHFVRRERGQQRVMEVAPQDLRFIRGIAIGQGARRRGRRGPAEIRDEDGRARAGKAAHTPPQHPRVRQVVQQAVADQDVVTLARQCAVGQKALEQAHPPPQPGMAPVADVGAGQHRRRTVHPVHHALRMGGGEAQRDVARTAPEVQHVAAHTQGGELGREQFDEPAVRLLEIGFRVGAGLRRRLHQLGLGLALHALRLETTAHFMVPCPVGMTTPGAIHQRFHVDFDYPVVFTRGLFHADNPVFADAVCRLGEPRRHRLLVLVDASVARHHARLLNEIQAYVAARAAQLELVQPPRPVPGGESIKNDLMGLGSLVNTLVERRLCRQSYVVVVGGGAVLDAVGFAAALVHRGLRLIRAPTTVLAQNDSGVGVKNAINFSGSKNLLGTFAPPFAVLNDLDFLRTLADREWTDGIAEAFKVAIIKDEAFFAWLAGHAAALRARDEAAMEHLVRRCAELHLEHIRSNGDPFEFGQARPLDFGHWAAHRLETMSSYKVSHGQAVAIGVALDSAYAWQRGWLTAQEFEAIHLGLATAGFTLWHDLLERRGGSGLDLLQGLRDFQEHLGGDLCVTMPQGVGRKFEIHDVETEGVEAALRILKERRLAASPR